MKTRQEVLALKDEFSNEIDLMLDEGRADEARPMMHFYCTLSWVLEDAPRNESDKEMMDYLDSMVIDRQNRHAESN